MSSLASGRFSLFLSIITVMSFPPYQTPPPDNATRRNDRGRQPPPCRVVCFNSNGEASLCTPSMSFYRQHFIENPIPDAVHRRADKLTRLGRMGRRILESRWSHIAIVSLTLLNFVLIIVQLMINVFDDSKQRTAAQQGLRCVHSLLLLTEKYQLLSIFVLLSGLTAAHD